MTISDKAYNVLKFICTILLPAISVLYVTLANIWGWPYAEEVAGTLAGISVFIGALIGISSKKYWSAQEDNEEEE